MVYWFIILVVSVTFLVISLYLLFPLNYACLSNISSKPILLDPPLLSGIIPSKAVICEPERAETMCAWVTGN